MIVFDTSIWIEYFRGRTPYLEAMGSLLEKRQVLGVECIFGELLQGITERGERRVILQCWDCLAKTGEEGLWLEAGEFSAIHRLSSKGIGLIDAAIAVVTLKTDSLLWTADKRLASVIPAKYRYAAYI